MDLDTSFLSVLSDEEIVNEIVEEKRLKTEKEELINTQKELNFKFINTILKYVKPDHNYSYHHDLRLLDFRKISEDLDWMPVKECRSKLKKLLQPLTREKSMFQVLSDSYNNLLKVHKGKPKGYNVFLIANVKTIKEKMKSTSFNMDAFYTAARSMWNKLTESEKLAYEGIKSCGKTPFDLYYEGVREKDDSVTLKQAKGVWGTLHMSEKGSFIKKSTNMKMSTENRPKDEEIENFDTVLGPDKKELYNYLSFHGMPERPSQSLSLCYLKKCGEYDDKIQPGKLVAIGANKLAELSYVEREKFKRKFEKSHKKYEKKLTKWKNDLDEVEKFMLKLFLQNGNGKSSSKTSRIKSVEELHSVVMPIMKMKFKINPSDAPPITAVHVYKQEVKEKKGKNITYYDALRRVKGLSKIEQTALQAKAEKNKVDFVNNLKSYVESLSEDSRSIFLGQNRRRFMKELKEDVFENDFPDSKYPIFVQQNNCKEETIKKEIVLPENQRVTKIKKPDNLQKNLSKNMESSISEIFDNIDLEDLKSRSYIKAKRKSKINGKSKNEKIDKNNNSPKKGKDDSSIKVKRIKEENAMEISKERSKRKRSNSPSESKKKRRKLNDDEGISMVKIDPDFDDSEEEDFNLTNVTQFLNSIEIENMDMKLEDFVKEEHEFDYFENE